MIDTIESPADALTAELKARSRKSPVRLRPTNAEHRALIADLKTELSAARKAYQTLLVVSLGTGFVGFLLGHFL